ncbi:MAG: diacylglycerol kinase family lipid kinase [Desulfobacterales bacterium]|nr:diacylglycerol kinase family lipid kinase [Desulfobacterales bacterium]
MKIALIANSRSKEVKNQNLSPDLEKKLLERNIRFDLFTTQYHGHAFEMVKQISIGEYDAIVTMGGDGTNYQVLNGLLKYHGDKQFPPMGILPVGRGNSFARDLQIFSIEDGISALGRQATRKVDVCRFSQDKDAYYFVNLMGFGFVTDVAKTAARFKWAADFSYVVGVFHRLLGLDFHEMVLEIDGTVISGKNCFVEICNSKYTGGNMLMAPEAQIDDGMFDVVVLSPLSRLSLISTLPKLFKGTHGENPAIQFIKAKSASVYTQPQKILLPDGEIFGTTPTEIKILPRLVRYFT